jgi:mono/diheme cytochrome c family protein/heme/copper-type cytochrome/quinol oxidase subunit 3
MSTIRIDAGMSFESAAEAGEMPRDESLLRQAWEWLRHAGFGAFEIALFAMAGALVAALIGGACLAAIAKNPDAAEWGHRLMNVQRGAGVAACLLLGSGALVGAIIAARAGSMRWVRISLAGALVCGIGYGAVLGLDYDALAYRGLLPGERFEPNERWVARKHGVKLPPKGKGAAVAAAVAAPVPVRTVDAVSGQRLFIGTCASCHGPQGAGMPGQGKDLRVSEFIAASNDASLLKFVIDGRQPWDPANTTKVAMPGRGGNPLLSDADLKDVVAFLRTLQKPDEGKGAQKAVVGVSPSDTKPALAVAAAPTIPFVPGSVIPSGAPAPSGLSRACVDEIGRPAWKAPPNAQSFFGAYFCATGVNAMHVLIACVAGGALLWMTRWRPDAHSLAAPVFLLGIFWWWTTAGWMFAFPLLYGRW